MPNCKPQPKRNALERAHLRRIAQPLILPKCRRSSVRPERHNFPDKNWQIPLTCEQFNARRNQRQLTLSYQLLPLKRRKAAQNATADPTELA
jgi:hypothetical protein